MLAQEARLRELELVLVHVAPPSQHRQALELVDHRHLPLLDLRSGDETAKLAESELVGRRAAPPNREAVRLFEDVALRGVLQPPAPFSALEAR